MLVGVPKEIKDSEYRVGLVPSTVRELTLGGHRVLVEQNAGLGAGLTDADYQAAGAEICGYRGEVHYEISGDPDYMTDNPNRRCPVITKAREVLGYHPNVLVDEGVRRFLQFLKHEGH